MVYLKKEELIKQNELLTNELEQYKNDNELLRQELEQLKEELEREKIYLNQYKKDFKHLEPKYFEAIKCLEDNVKMMNRIEARAEREIKEHLSKYKKLGRKQYKDKSTIKLMYSLYLDFNKSFKEIADTLNEKGIKTKLNKDWVKSSISCIMKNEKNIKKYLNEEQYKKFIELLESNKRNIKRF